MRIDKKERIQLTINKIAAIPVNSSIMVTSLNLYILREVRTTRQNPNKLEDVFKICDDLLFAINFKLCCSISFLICLFDVALLSNYADKRFTSCRFKVVNQAHLL